MATADHPDIPFVEARTVSGGPAYTPGRPDGPPLWVVVHDMEFPERADAAEWNAAYFARGADGRSVSSHYTADRDSIIQCVRLRDVAWTVGNRPGNYRGINWELAGYASQTREQWLDEFGRAMLTRVAVVMRRDMATFNIPARTLTDDQVRARERGVTSHAQLGRVFGGTDHTDPGRAFPWDHLINLLQGDDMTKDELVAALRDPADPLGRALRAVSWQYAGGGIPAGMSTLGVLAQTHALAQAIAAKVDIDATELAAIRAAAQAGAQEAIVASADALAAAVVARLPEQALTKAHVEQAVRDAFAAGLAEPAS